MKRTLALILAVCLCLSCMVMVCSAADVEAKEARAIRVEICQVSAAYMRRADNTSAEIIGQLMRNDKFHTATNANETWYYGMPDPSTDLYKEFPDTYGYVKAVVFQRY